MLLVAATKIIKTQPNKALKLSRQKTGGQLSLVVRGLYE